MIRVLLSYHSKRMLIRRISSHQHIWRASLKSMLLLGDMGSREISALHEYDQKGDPRLNEPWKSSPELIPKTAFFR